MATPSEKPVGSLDALRTLQDRGIVAVRSADLVPTHRERLIRHGFLQPDMKGWYVAVSPDRGTGDSTAWYASFRSFCVGYLSARFGPGARASRACPRSGWSLRRWGRSSRPGRPRGRPGRRRGPPASPARTVHTWLVLSSPVLLVQPPVRGMVQVSTKNRPGSFRARVISRQGHFTPGSFHAKVISRQGHFAMESTRARGPGPAGSGRRWLCAAPCSSLP